MTIKPTVAGRSLLSTSQGKGVRVKLQVTFTPRAIGSGDQEITPAGAIVVSRNVKLGL